MLKMKRQPQRVSLDVFEMQSFENFTGGIFRHGQCVQLQLATVGNGDLACGFATLWALCLHLLDELNSLHNTAKHNMLPIQPGRKINGFNTFNILAIHVPDQAYQAVLAVQMKNCDPLVLGPALAMDRIPGPVCLNWKFSSANFSP